jgi:hypothetical protein
MSSPLLPAPAALRPAAPSSLLLLRVVARVMVSLGVLCMISGGIVIISCVLTIVQGALWLKISASPSRYLTPDTISRSGCRAARNAAIAAIFFASLEFIILIIVLPIFASLGNATALPRGSCSTSSCTVYCYPSSVQAWMMYAAGNAVATTMLNIALAAATLSLVKHLRSAVLEPSTGGVFGGAMQSAPPAHAKLYAPPPAPGDDDPTSERGALAVSAGAILFCAACGARSEQGMRFCESCGKAVR